MTDWTKRLTCKDCGSPNMDFVKVMDDQDQTKYKCNDCNGISFYPVLYYNIYGKQSRHGVEQ